MSTAGYRAIRWAKSVPVVLRADGKPDQVAHHILLVLATYAGADGHARPSVGTIATEAYVTSATARSALRRLEAAGLIVASGDWNGTQVWKLALTTGYGVDPVMQERRARAREANAARQKRYRERRTVTPSQAVTPPDRNAVAGRYVTPSEPVTPETVTPSQAVTNAVGRRYVTPSRPLHPQVTPPVTTNGTTTELEELMLGFAEQQAPPATPEAFAEFWKAFPRKRGKQEALRAYLKVIKKTDPAVVLAGAHRYAEERQGQDPAYTKYPAGWLSSGRWADTPEPAKNGHHQPWRNPEDQSVYDEEI